MSCTSEGFKIIQLADTANDRLFADDTTVAPATAGAPTTAEILTFAGLNRDTIIYYTGTDVSTDAPTYVYHIDASGNVTMIEKPSAVTEYAQDFVIADFVAETITITASTHLLGLNPVVQIMSGSAAPYTVTDVDSVTVATNGDVTFSVTAGLEFDGRIIIK